MPTKHAQQNELNFNQDSGFNLHQAF